jgi:GTP1/Obg family GTP-binding protein
MKRFFTRLRYWNRNFEFHRQADKLIKAASKRISVIEKVPLDRRKELVRNDPVLAECAKLHKFLNDLFDTVGGTNEKQSKVQNLRQSDTRHLR